MFVDQARIKVKGGDGGDGCCSFRREKYVPKGGPNGGDGGRGGDVVFVTDLGEQSLVDLVFNRHFQGQRGIHGKGKDLHGRRGDDKRIRVPVGTIIRKVNHGDIIIDLDKPDMEFIIAKGGKGGKGNARFLCNANKAPRECEPGEPGEEKEVELELKTIADIGLVGFPNAGKSTLLKAISNASPKTAPYPFTTLHPIVGVVEYPDFQRLTVADIPGLIEGAHDDIGLGHDFLRHIERSKAFAFILDCAGVDCREPWDDFESLKKELDLYMPGLSKRKAVVIANKIDLLENDDNLELLREAIPEHEIIPISAAENQNLDTLKEKFEELVGTLTVY